MLLKVAVLLLVAVSLVSAQANRVAFRPCPGGHHVPEWVESTQCTTTRCTLTRGQLFTARVHVIPREAHSTLAITLTATLLGFPFDLSIPAGYENACEFLEAGARCPVAAGGSYVWGLQFPIQTFYPTVSIVITCKLNITQWILKEV